MKRIKWSPCVYFSVDMYIQNPTELYHQIINSIKTEEQITLTSAVGLG